jgi:site-specific DNA-methyltransferase (adenine-specific)/modification methylase
MVEPVVIGNATLYLGDCRDILPHLPRVDAVVADPPYGYAYKPSRMGLAKSAVFKRNFGPEDLLLGDTGKMDFDPRPFLPLADKHIWWGANCYADKLPNSKAWLTWFKADGNTTIDQGHAELAWTNLRFAIRGMNHRWCGMVRDSERKSQNVHPTQKPVEVMKWCLSFLPDAQTILDPFAGSGTTGVAAIQMGKSFIGIEREPKYFEAMCRRIREANGDDAGPLFEEQAA